MGPHVTSVSEIGGTDSAALRTTWTCLRDNAIGLAVGMLNWASFGGSWVEIFTQTWQTCQSWSSKMAVRWAIGYAGLSSLQFL